MSWPQGMPKSTETEKLTLNENNSWRGVAFSDGAEGPASGGGEQALVGVQGETLVPVRFRRSSKYLQNR